MIGAILASTAGMSVLDYENSVAEFYRSAKHMTLGTPYRDAVYQPMVELLRYLEATRLQLLHHLRRRPGLHAPDHR